MRLKFGEARFEVFPESGKNLNSREIQRLPGRSEGKMERTLEH